MNIRRHFATLFLLFGVCVFPFQSVNSQELPEDELATFVFDVDIARLKESQLVTTIGLETFTQLLEMEDILPPEVSLKNLDRINGAFEFSETWESLDQANGDDLPMDFYVQLHFNSQDAVEAFEESMKDNSVVYEDNGIEYYGPEENGFTPTNLRVRFGETMVEAGTTTYLYRSDREVLSEKLSQMWAEIPQDNIVRAAIDVEASKDLADGFLELIARDLAFGDPMVKSLVENTLEVVGRIDSGTAYMDLDNPTLLSVKLRSEDEKTLEKIKGVADGLMFMGVFPLKGLIESLPFASEDHSQPLLNLVDQLKTEQQEGMVVMEINKSEEFDEVAKTVYFPLLKEWAVVYSIRNNLQSLSYAASSFTYSNEDFYPYLKPESSQWNEDLSWRVRILKHNYQPGFRELAGLSDTEQSWEHESNQQLIDRMPSAFGPGGKSSNIVWVKTKIQKREDITDGERNTLMLVRLPEAPEVPWTHPDDTISVIKLLKLVSNLKDGEKIYAVTYGSSLVVIDNSWSKNKLKAYVTPAAGDSTE